jgi:predicted anti-sigma-YlaC factor YlaD
MGTMTSRGQLCERAREWASLQLDGELSELERALLDAHLDRCDSCARFRLEAAATTSLLRGAEVEPVARPISLPRRARPGIRTFQTGVAVALVVTAAGLGSLLGVLRSQPAQRAEAAHVSTVAFEDNANSLRQLRRAGLIAQSRTRPGRNLLVPSV